MPVIHCDTVVFTAEGDLWKVGVDGGVAQRLTTHHGVESHSSISPDGTTIAFVGQYEGPSEVYTMPLAGGLPIRRTHGAEMTAFTGWTPAGKLLCATQQFSMLPNTQLATVDLDTGDTEPVPLAQASDGVYDPTGKTLFFTRLAFQGSHTKRYRGGTAQNIWRFTEGEDEAALLTTDYEGTSRSPMWWDGRVYFVSDRDGTMNVWSMDEDGGDLRQHTQHVGWDVKSPSSHEGRVVYQLGADLYVLDIVSGKTSPVRITLGSDFDQTRARWVKRPIDYLTSAHPSPDGDRVVLTARGKIFVAPVRDGRFVESTRESGIRYRNARFFPGGKAILALSDETGELEFVKVPANGVGDPERLTDDGEVFRYSGYPSLDGNLVAYVDKDQHLWVRDLEKQETVRADSSETMVNIRGLRWSPDSRWLAYVATADNEYSHIKLYSIEDATSTAVTTDRVDSYDPAFSPDGTWLYFLSDRHLVSVTKAPWGQRQPEPYLDKTTKVYLVALVKGERSPFRSTDELHQPEEKTDEKENKAKNLKLELDLDGIEARAMEVPVSPSNYSSLSVARENLFWLDEDRTPTKSTKRLMALEIKNRDVEVKKLLDDVKGYELSSDGKKLLVQKDKVLHVIDATHEPPKKLDKTRVDISKWTFSLDPRQEWRQMLVEAWRLERDFFYDRNMHGVDWGNLLEKHLPLVDRVTDREELDDLIAQMVSELAALHTFVFGGDKRRGLDRVTPASLGAELVRDETADGYRVHHIYKSDPDYPDKLAPLAQPDLEINEGDVIEAIDGVPTLAVEHAATLLKNKAGQQVLLTVRPQGADESAQHIVKPVTASAAARLRYDDWELLCRSRVEEKGDGDIGYVHLRAMGAPNFSEWARNYYPVFNRKGLIVDVRHNRGGNIDSWILDRLMRKAWFYWQPRVGKPKWNMQHAFRGHMVALCNERTASDGEAFIDGFRRLGLGKIIGTRTWGGEIWLSFNTQLVDKGIASAAEIGVYAPEGEWLIEGHGVDPDIVVDNLPHATFNGEDAQLDAATAHLQALIEREPVEVPPAPPYPDKSFEYENA